MKISRRWPRRDSASELMIWMQPATICGSSGVGRVFVNKFKMDDNYHDDAVNFAALIREAKLPGQIQIGKFTLATTLGVSERI